MCKCVCVCVCVCVQPCAGCTHISSLVCVHIISLIRAHTHTSLCVHTHTQVYACTHTHKSMRAHIHLISLMRAHTHIISLMRAHTHISLCMHTQVQPQGSILIFSPSLDRPSRTHAQETLSPSNFFLSLTGFLECAVSVSVFVSVSHPSHLNFFLCQ